MFIGHSSGLVVLPILGNSRFPLGRRSPNGSQSGVFYHFSWLCPLFTKWPWGRFPLGEIYRAALAQP